MHELGDILYVEEQLVSEVLPKLIGEVNDEDLQSARHRLTSAPLLALRATRSPFSTRLKARYERREAWLVKQEAAVSAGSA